ncbi:MAG: hypothetical protein H6722_13185 [Sandaracinus sp.]|nr:hypothetical protein [Sandaracinus sp.]MCB9613397.1 hypothetical protein [Sandaracinus sp.]
MRIHTRLLLLLALASPHVVGCGGSDDDVPPADGGAPEADAGFDANVPPEGDAGPDEDASVDPDGGAPTDELLVEHVGGRLRGRPLALSMHQRTLWVGTSTVADPASSALRGGIGRLDTTSGVLDVIEDALPRVSDGIDEGPASTAGAITVGDTTYVAGQTSLLAIEGESVREVALTDATGGALVAYQLGYDATRDRIWIGTDGGLVAMSSDETIVTRVGSDVLGGSQIGPMAVDTVRGAVFAVVVREDFSTRVVRVADGAVTNSFEPGVDGVPAGFVGDLAFAPDLNGVYVALASWNATRGALLAWHPSDAGPAVDVLLTEGELALAARGESGAFGAARLHLAAEDDVLVIGGQLRAAGPASSPIGGGLVFAKLSTLGTDAPELYGLSTGLSKIPGDHVTDIAYDTVAKRFYVALQQPCSEVRLGNAGVWAIRFEREQPVFELPWLSGVRDLETHGGLLLAAIRDDVPGQRCEGVNVQVGLVRVQADGTGAVVPLLEGGRGEELPTTRRGMTELASRGTRLVVAGFREDTWAGPIDDGRWIQGPLELGISLFPHAVAWESDTVFWVGGTATHSSSDTEFLADVGPRGVARVQLGASGSVDGHVQYVRGVRDPSPGVFPGLPSSEIVDVVPLSNGRAFVVCGAERVRDGGNDRDDDYPVFTIGGAPRLGGVAIVDFDGADDVVGTEDDHTIVRVAGTPELPDPRAATLAPDGVSLLVLDANRGLVRIDEELVLHEETLPMEPSYPHVVMETARTFVAGGAEGAVVRVDDATAVLTAYGHVWSALSREDDVVYLGSDEGLVRVTTAGGTLPGEHEAPVGEAVPFVPPRR